MARRKDYLENQARKLGISIEGKTLDQLMNDLRDVICKNNDILPQIAPMLCRNATDFLDYNLPKPWDTRFMGESFWSNNNCIAEEKIDGVRLKLHVSSNGVRMDSRRKSDVDYAYTERTGNFPQFQELSVVLKDKFLGITNSITMFRKPCVKGSLVLDGEVYMTAKKIDTGSVVTDSNLNATIAITNSAPEISIPLQKKYGYAVYYIFDVICDLPYRERRGVICEIVGLARSKGIPVILPTFCVVDKMSFYEQIIEGGGEGVVLKNVYGYYEPGKRSKSQYKLKVFREIDCFITGYTPGEHGNEGLVGAFLVSVFLDGKKFEIGAVSGITKELRKEVTAEDGSLKDEFYGKVVTCRYQELTKTKRMRSAVFVGFRPDKSMHDCQGQELRRE